MKILWKVFCLFVGHNKIIKAHENGIGLEYSSFCTQCHAQWKRPGFMKKNERKFSVTILQLKGQAKILPIPRKKNRVKSKKSVVNFYLL